VVVVTKTKVPMWSSECILTRLFGMIRETGENVIGTLIVNVACEKLLITNAVKCAAS
jgi:hypothetical protein